MAGSSEIYTLCTPFFLILKFFGLTCFTIEKKSRQLRTTPFDIFLFAFTMSVWIFFSWIQLSQKMPGNHGSSVVEVILNSLWYYQHNIQHFFGLAVIVFNFKQRKIIGKLVKAIFDFDKEAEMLGWNLAAQSLLFTVVVLTFIACVMLTAVALTLNAYEYNWLKLLSPASIAFNVLNYCLILLFFFVVSQQFIISVFCVRSRLRSIAVNFG